MNPDRDPLLEGVARELRSRRMDPSIDARIMAAVRSTAQARWPRLLMPRRLLVRPLPWTLGAAAALIVAGFIGASVGGPDSFFRRLGKQKVTSEHVQFTLVAPDAKKVAVVGDFNAWDPSHAGFQARHTGGGVWTVTAKVPAGHHRYSFVVDDSVWMADPMAPRAHDNDFGLPKSAIVVGSEQ